MAEVKAERRSNSLYLNLSLNLNLLFAAAFFSILLEPVVREGIASLGIA